MNYVPIFDYMNRLNLPPDDWEQMFDDIRTIEGAALDAMKTT